ncbi:hypothetical protein FLGE108171_14920 [Flavobacterium gelidilacus]
MNTEYYFYKPLSTAAIDNGLKAPFFNEYICPLISW